MPFNGLRVLSLESRRADEMTTLIRKQGGTPFVAPSMREVPLDENQSALEFGTSLLHGAFDCLILLTGAGTRLLWKTLTTHHTVDEIKAAVGALTVVVRGPKPSAVLRELGLAANVMVPEPNTWRELLETMRPRTETRVAVQEYGKSNPELLDGLRAQGRNVVSVRIYGWDLPEDLAPLREAAHRLAARQFDVALFTTSMQVVNLMRIAAAEGIADPVADGLRSCFIGSIGPTTSETLEDYGLQAGFEPTHPRMGLLVNEAASHGCVQARQPVE